MSLSYTYRNIEYLPPITFGFKIHVSAIFQSYDKVLEIVKPYLEDKKIAYKFINNREDVYKVFSVHEIAGECGKLITIYPSPLILMETLEDLYQLLTNQKGIYILSDRPYKDSSTVFYRFGLIRDSVNVFQDGIPTATSLNGEEWQDYPKPYFDLPSWIEDIQPPLEEVEASYLGNHYEVTSVIHQSGGGNVYLGLDKKFRTSVILKETRLDILSFYDVEKKELREKEFDTSIKLQERGIEQVVTPIERVNEWINSYYIYHYIQGEVLTDFCKKYGINSYSREYKQKNLRLFRGFLEIVHLLVKTLSYFHSNDLILNDIHSDNFVMGYDGRIYFVDLENSYFYGDKSFVGIVSRTSLESWNYLDGKKADYHKLGNMLLFLFLLARLAISEKSQVEPLISEKLLVSYGIVSNLPEFITYLLSEEVCSDGVVSRLNFLSAKLVPVKETIPELPSSEGVRKSFIQRVEDICSNFSNYKKHLSSDELTVEYNSITRLMNSEQNLGLGGLSGVVVLLHDNGYHTLARDGLNMILNRLEETEEGLQVPIERGVFSPYVFNGLSGVIQMLYYIDRDEYRSLILELRKGLYSEFAQYEGYTRGSLGIADTLLLTTNYRSNKKLERCVKSLILSSYIYHQERHQSLDDLSDVLSHYYEVYSF